MPDLNPLTAADLTEINRSIGNINDVLSLISRSKLAGLDMEVNEASAKEALERLKKLKNAFFPNQ